LEVGTVSDLGVLSSRVQEFYRDNWARPIALSDAGFYSWQCVQTPSGPSGDNCVIAYDVKADRIAGVMGLTPRQFSLNERLVDGAEMTTWIVHEDYRTSGAGAKILKQIMASYEVLIGMGITEQALPIYLRSGFRFMRHIPRYIKVINYERIKPFCQTNDLGQRLVAKWSKTNIGNYRQAPLSDGDIDSAYKKARAHLNMFDRGAAQINWRYRKHPMFHYEVHHVSCGKTDDGAIVALRIHDTEAGFRICHVMDLFGNTQSIDAGRSFVEDYALQNGVDVIDFYCTSSAISRHFIANQWFSVQDDACLQFPHLFSPLEMRNPPTTSLIYWARQGFSELADLSKLYLTKQDADLDRPVLQQG